MSINICLWRSGVKISRTANNGKRTTYGGRTWGDGRQGTSGYDFSDWWLLTDPCDCDWQVLTTILLAPASPHCWAQQVVWRLAEIPNKMDITGINNSRPCRGECWARSTPTHTMYQGSLTLHCLRIAVYRATLRQTSYWKSLKWPVVLTGCTLQSNKSSPIQRSENRIP